MTTQLSEDQTNIVKQILNDNLEDAEYRIFGSRATGKAKQYSDLDIVLIGKTPVPLLTLSTLEEKFAESDLPFKVDLVDWLRITTEFQQKIQQEWKKI